VKTDASVDDYLAGIAGVRGADARALNALMIEVTGVEPSDALSEQRFRGVRRPARETRPTHDRRRVPLRQTLV
jgi:hypothetical protein